MMSPMSGRTEKARHPAAGGAVLVVTVATTVAPFVGSVAPALFGSRKEITLEPGHPTVSNMGYTANACPSIRPGSSTSPPPSWTRSWAEGRLVAARMLFPAPAKPNDAKPVFGALRVARSSRAARRDAVLHSMIIVISDICQQTAVQESSLWCSPPSLPRPGTRP